MGILVKCKYLGPTSFRGSRIKVTSYKGSNTVEWQHDKDSYDNNISAIKEHLNRFELRGDDRPWSVFCGDDNETFLLTLDTSPSATLRGPL
jgi:hypothetical protein